MNIFKILVEHTGRPIEETEDVEEIRNAMIEYAEQYAKKCLEIAAENAVTFIPSHPHLHLIKAVSKDSILNIQFPSHD